MKKYTDSTGDLKCQKAEEEVKPDNFLDFLRRLLYNIEKEAKEQKYAGNQMPELRRSISGGRNRI